MDSKLRERFERAGPVRAVDRVASGSPAVFVLRLPRGRMTPKTIDGAVALARRGMTLLAAKRAMESLLASGSVFVSLPTVESQDALAAELAASGISAAPAGPPAETDIRELRDRLGLSREQFALRYGLEIESVRNWEAGRRPPDAAARSYLQAISNDPEGVARAYAPTPA